MRRLTTDTPDGNFEIAMNYVYDDGGEAFIRHDGKTDNVPLWEYIDGLCRERGCHIALPQASEQTDWRCCDCVMDGESCPVSVMYIFAAQAVQCRGVLKRYEDTGLTPDEIKTIAGGQLVTARHNVKLQADLQRYDDTGFTPDEINAIAKSQIVTAKHNVELQEEVMRLKAERDALVEAIRKGLHALSYESIEWTHGEHPRVVELDEIDDLLDEFTESEDDDGQN